MAIDTVEVITAINDSGRRYVAKQNCLRIEEVRPGEHKVFMNDGFAKTIHGGEVETEGEANE